MFMSTGVYLKRIMHTLETVVAPEVENDYARGQVYAAIDLLNQLTDKIEYKSDLIRQEIEMGSEAVEKVVRALEGVADPPDDLKGFLQELGREEGDTGLGMRQRVEEALCLAIDFFHAHCQRLDPEAAFSVDSQLRDYLTRISTRDLGLMKPPRIDKISRSKR